MHKNQDQIVTSATDLGNFLACRRKTALDHAVMRGELTKPKFDNSVLEILRLRGAEHEQRFIDAERAAGHAIVDLSPRDADNKPRPGLETRELQVAATLDAMRNGASRIVQAALASSPALARRSPSEGGWFGYADVLRRVETPSPNLGAWSYEALDTKLAQETKGATVLQLSLYSDLIAEIQGCSPEFFYVVTPLAEEKYRVNDYAAYYRMVKRGLLESVGELEQRPADREDPRTLGPLHPWTKGAFPYPDPVAHCSICDWSPECSKVLRGDDHLSFVANCSRQQRAELGTVEITTLERLGRDGLPAGFRPSRGAPATYHRLQDQARLQLAARETKRPSFDPLPIQKDLGLCLLPEPSPGDVFLDLEGATWAREGGREYLFGIVTIDETGAPVYEDFKAFDDGAERTAFETVIDRLIAAFDAHPGMHVYHYAPYEPTALKKLMGRYATRGPELDRLLRAERFVDLYSVVRHAVRAGIESYSIKELEQFYGYTREVTLAAAGANRRLVEHALDMGTPHLVKPDELEVVRIYNRDDCVSTWHLRQWLEGLRQEAIGRGLEVPRSVKEIKENKPGELEARARDLRAALVPDLPVDPTTWSDADRARHLLAYTVDWHSRETKASWWEYYRLRDLPPEDQVDESMVVVGLEFVERVDQKLNKKTGKPTGTVTDRYRYDPRQEMEIDEDDSLTLADESDWGKVVAVDRIAKTIDVAKGPKTKDIHASSAFSFLNVGTGIIQESVLAFADDVLANGLASESAPRDCRRELLLRRSPNVAGGLQLAERESPSDLATRIAPLLDHTVLAIQGPPGTGKSYTGARMICALVAAGKKVGVTANSHKVIRNLLKGVRNEAAKVGQTVRIGHRGGEEPEDAGIQDIDVKTEVAVNLLQTRVLNVLGAVAWTWASDKAIEAVDVLFVDEAGQMSLANVLGAARAAKSIVLLGDQQQLDQPSKASHPDGIGVSALGHILAGARTMPEGRGIFLPTTRRLAPGIAKFTSEVFYEGRLQELPGLENQRLAHLPQFEGGALWALPVAHTGNQSYSTEEVDVIATLVERLMAEGQWIDRECVERRLTSNDILIVAPYNAQVSRLAERLPNARVGTVDKFQGQQAPVVIYSMATSRPEDAPRGMEFLYSLNRLNVATSRAQCAVIVVANPALFEPSCSTPRQMQLANGLGRYREMAQGD